MAKIDLKTLNPNDYNIWEAMRFAVDVLDAARPTDHPKLYIQLELEECVECYEANASKNTSGS